MNFVTKYNIGQTVEFWREDVLETKNGPKTRKIKLSGLVIGLTFKCHAEIVDSVVSKKVNMELLYEIATEASLMFVGKDAIVKVIGS